MCINFTLLPLPRQLNHLKSLKTSFLAGGIALPRVVNELDYSDSFDSVSSDCSSAKENIVLNPSAGLQNVSDI